ncbi:MAG: DUF3108 domain-containing protein [Candidatus Omnitrophota bacterium]
MSKLKVIFLILTLVFALFFIKDRAGRGTGQPVTSLKDKNGPSERIEKGIGEKMTYDVKLGAINLGKSVFTHLPSIEVNGRVLSVMVFETSLARFKDTEVIYADPQTILPVKVERDISKWFSREKITEEYDQEAFSVTIKKQGSSRPLVFKKDSPIHNAVLLPQYIRYFQELLDVEGVIIANLPNRRYEIRRVSTEEIKVPAGIFKTYHLSSTPNHIDIWISADDRRIPVKIKSNNLALGYVLVLKEYTPGN